MNIVNRNPYTRLSHYAWGDSLYVYCFNSLFATFIFDIFLCFRLFAILFYHPYDKYAFLARLRWMCIQIQFFLFSVAFFYTKWILFHQKWVFLNGFCKNHICLHTYLSTEWTTRKKTHKKTRLLCMHIFVEGMYHYHHL